MAALIREPPRAGRPDAARQPARERRRARRLGDRAQVAAAAATGRRPASRASDRSRRSPSSSAASSSPRGRAGLTSAAARAAPSGIVLVDKPAGPVVVRARRASCAGAPARGRGTRARSTRSPPGCCSCCLGRGDEAGAAASSGSTSATLTEVDLDGAHVDRRPGGRGRRASTEPPASAELERAARAPPRRGRAADPGGLGGQDRRRARLPAAPARRRVEMPTAALDGSTRSTSSRLRDGVVDARPARRARGRTCARSPTRSAATAATLRRTEVGPVRGSTEADPERTLAPSDAGRARRAGGCGSRPRSGGRRARRAMRGRRTAPGRARSAGAASAVGDRRRSTASTAATGAVHRRGDARPG